MRRPHLPGGSGRARRSALLGVLVSVLGVTLLAATVTIAVSLYGQAGQVAANLDETQAIVDANVRTLSQTQRELLELRYLLVTDAPAEEVLLKTEFVTQRAHESALSYQQHTLGTAALLEVARRDEQSWLRDTLPLVRRAVAPRADPRDRVEALAHLEELEASYNELVSAGEINRKAQADTATARSRELLTQTRWLLVGTAVCFLTSVSIFLLGAVLLTRVNRTRAAAQRDLLSLNGELQRYAQVVQATRSMVVVTSAEGRIEWVNDAFERATGWTLEEVRGQQPGDFLQGDDTDPDTVTLMRESIRAGEGFSVEVANYTAAGDQFWVAVEASPLHDEDGRLSGYVGVQSDVTERHEASLLLEKARVEAEESAQQKATFLATMSHEIRTPLNAVLGLTDLLMLTELDDEQREYLETAHRSGAHLLALVNDILDFSALESGRGADVSEDFSLRGLVEDAVGMFTGDAERRGLALDLAYDDALPTAVTGDPTELRQVLVNVVGNALKFTEEGGVTVSVLVDGEGTAETCPVRVVVRDTGIGVPRWRIPSLFESFARGDVSTTRRFGGTGLGLAICLRLVERMGGTIDLDSELGEGTTVTVALPLRLAARPEGVRSEQTGLPDWSGLRLLVAEDDPVNQTVVTKMLRRFGIEPDVVGNGRLAVEAVRERPYDVVLLDIEMPVMDGLTAVRHIRAAHVGETPWIVALTANALRGDRERFLAAGMDDYASKPVNLDLLDAALGRAATHRGLREGSASGPVARPARAASA